MISLPRSKRLVSLLRISLVGWLLAPSCLVPAQHLAAYHDNQNRFFIFDNGRTIQAEHLPVKDFSIGGNCVLYVDSRSHLKMYFQGEISTLEVSKPHQFKAYDYLAAYNIGGIVKIIEQGKLTTVSTNAMSYLAEDSIITFYDSSRELLAVYYQGRIQMLEDGLAGRPVSVFHAGDNLVAWISTLTRTLKVFYQGRIIELEPFLSGGTFKAGKDVLAYVNQSDLRFKVFYKGSVFEVEEFRPDSWQTGDGVVAYVDNTGTFKIFGDGETTTISTYPPDFYQVQNRMVIYGDRGYFKVWYNNRDYTLETRVPESWKADWNTIVYLDLNRNVKIFSQGESKVLTYDLAEGISIWRDLVLVNKGMNNYNVYYRGKKY